MSFQVFMKDLYSTDLSLTRLEEVWNYRNLQNKSQLIDVLSSLLMNEIKKRCQNQGEGASIPAAEVKKMCDNFVYKIVRTSIPSQKLYLEPITILVNDLDPKYRINAATGIVFRPKVENPSDKAEDWIATKVLKGNRLYPLKLTHMNICITNGWYFETDSNIITSPFKV